MLLTKRAARLLLLITTLITTTVYGADDGQLSSDVSDIDDQPALEFAVTPLNAISPETVRDFVMVIDLVRRQYAGNVNDEQLFQGAMRGVLEELDGYGEFLDETAFKNLQAFTEGTVASVGLKAHYDNVAEQWVVSEILAGSAADNAGIKIGDYLHQINDKSLNTNINSDDISQLLTGIAGSQITVTVSSQGRVKKTLRLQRTTPVSDKLQVTVQGDIVMVRLPVFTERTRDELIEALAVINTPIKGMVIDVRNNPGGVLLSAIQIASLFTTNESMVKIEEYNKPLKTLGSQGTAFLDKMPIILLQNRYSASAAEVLSQALKNDQESVIVGETSYGKGSIQSIIPLNNGGAVKLTTAHYLSGKGEKIDGVGVPADIAINFNNNRWIDEVVDIIRARQLEVGMLVSLPSDY